MFLVKTDTGHLGAETRSTTRENYDLHNFSICTGDVPVHDLSTAPSFPGGSAQEKCSLMSSIPWLLGGAL